MVGRFDRTKCLLHYIGRLLQILSILLLIPLMFVFASWQQNGEGWPTALSFMIPAGVSVLIGFLLTHLFKSDSLDATTSMLLCALGWIVVSAIGAIPYVIGIEANYLNSYFEAMSGFTTTGITVFSGLDEMPQSILFWRSLTQWLGGLGILSFFMAITFGGGGVHHMFGAESHKIAADRPMPGLYNTLRILWGIYILLTSLACVSFMLAGMSFFDGICHALTALSTGGYSPHDSSIEYYRINGYAHFKAIEYTVAFFMMLGGINFLVHFRVLTGRIRALWDTVEIRYWWGLLGAFVVIIMFDRFHVVHAGMAGAAGQAESLEECFRISIFQTISLLTTTGFGTKDIGGGYFGALSMQLFMVMMVIGGCVGSTGGGFKVLRIAILSRLTFREIFKLRTSEHTANSVVIDKKIIPADEVQRVAGLLFAWIALLLVGGGITAILSHHGPWESLSGMFSAVGNIGPCYISVPDMIAIHPIVKIVYIFGMLAGRLEILPVLLLFSGRAWKY